MKVMTELFIPYQEALELKNLGFNEPCLAGFQKVIFGQPIIVLPFLRSANGNTDLEKCNTFTNFHIIEHRADYYCTSPTFHQAFKFFREKYGLFYDNLCYIGNVWKFTTYSNNEKDYFQSKEYNTYEEAELACLQKLISIAHETNRSK